MYKGIVRFDADVRRGTAITFPSLVFRPAVDGVEKVEVEALRDEEGRNSIGTTVHLEKVPTQNDGLEIARNVASVVLNRLCFNHTLSIGTPRCTKEDFQAIHAAGGHVLLAGTGHFTITAAGEMTPVLGLSPDRIKALLEEKALAGESNFGLFRSARQSESPTEEFLHLYQIILMLCGDEQREVDAWIKGQDAAVPENTHGASGQEGDGLHPVAKRVRPQARRRQFG